MNQFLFDFRTLGEPTYLETSFWISSAHTYSAAKVAKELVPLNNILSGLQTIYTPLPPEGK